MPRGERTTLLTTDRRTLAVSKNIRKRKSARREARSQRYGASKQVTVHSFVYRGGGIVRSSHGGIQSMAEKTRQAWRRGPPKLMKLAGDVTKTSLSSQMKWWLH